MSIFREYIVKPLTRSSKWPKLRRHFLYGHSRCACCGRTTKLEVHHIKDFSTHPELELNYSNLITLCRNGTQCHLAIGHLGDWKRANSCVADDAAYLLYRYTTEKQA